ncbi:LysR family transcriptional regulator [Exilibacterium tricleocarpae]|uniref:LysR family transcriptional regulator n=1 Tax=Exilibacterium tricleocarpae TaxID=2591008 RepID=A0A545TSK1_9GAMM|nr:LysR family transcriptional regulator [Exilibacterium tricleocarpae]TQV80197.1 LysR family transcriptional regulator [Exilibacterium tricleocarpae]
MKLNKVDLNLFVAFDAIYTASSLSGAAERLHVTQPAMSNTLNRLRELFDDPLFVRSGRGMMPTPGAQNIIGPVREALATLNTSLHKLKSFDPATSDKRFRFSMRDLNEAQLFPDLLGSLQREAPGIVIESFQVPREDSIKELANGRLDFVVDAPVLSDPQLCHQKLTEDEVVCVVREDHPITRETLTLEKYLTLPHILVTSRRDGQSMLDRELEKIGKFRRIAMRTQHSLMVPELLRRTDMSMTTIHSFSRFHATRALALPFAVPPVEMYLYWHKSADLDPASQWLRAKLTSSLKQ